MLSDNVPNRRTPLVMIENEINLRRSEKGLKRKRHQLLDKKEVKKKTQKLCIKYILFKISLINYIFDEMSRNLKMKMGLKSK